MADVLFTNSYIESKQLSDWFSVGIEKFHQTRNSISEAYSQKGDPELFRNEYKVIGGFVLSVANIDELKNTHTLVSACKHLNLKLVTIGHIKNQEYFNSFVHDYEGYIHLGPFENEEMLKSAYSAYSAYSIFALVSYCETPGIAALEAAAQGKKIVITQEGCASEYFSDYAKYVNPHELNSVIDGLRLGLSESRLSGLSEMIVAEYKWDKTAEEIINEYSIIS